MHEKETRKSELVEIDLCRIFRTVLKKIWMVMLVSILGAAVAFAGTYFLIVPEYTATAKFYVNNRADSTGNASAGLSSGDLTASRNLVDSYIVILNTEETLNAVIDCAGVDRTYAQVLDMLRAEAVNETEIFQVTVTGADPREAQAIANAIVAVLPERISHIIEGTSVKVVEAVAEPLEPSFPSYKKNTLIGFLLGFLLTVVVVVLRVIQDTTIRAEEDVAKACEYPVLAAIPDMAATEKKSRAGVPGNGKQPVRIGENISFASAEAYKLLRAKLRFSLADAENRCGVIGIACALTGEGNSVTAVNLAYSLSRLNKRVILLECNMRCPSIAERLNIPKEPGISDFLADRSHLDGLIRCWGTPGEQKAFHVIAAGEKPPNPAELLDSPKMREILAALRERYDYVLLDLPPIAEVSDALPVAEQTDGVLLVVRQDSCTRPALQEAVRRLEFVDARILGVIYNCAGESSGKYNPRGRRRKK